MEAKFELWGHRDSFFVVSNTSILCYDSWLTISNVPAQSVFHISRPDGEDLHHFFLSRMQIHDYDLLLVWKAEKRMRGKSRLKKIVSLILSRSVKFSSQICIHPHQLNVFCFLMHSVTTSFWKQQTAFKLISHAERRLCDLFRNCICGSCCSRNTFKRPTGSKIWGQSHTNTGRIK